MCRPPCSRHPRSQRRSDLGILKLTSATRGWDFSGLWHNGLTSTDDTPYPRCMIDTGAIRMRCEADGSKRDERGQRLFAASEARAAGWGGVAAGAKITGVLRKRILGGFDGLGA